MRQTMPKELLVRLPVMFFLTEKGFQPLHTRKTALTDGWGETGIDGVFKKGNEYFIVEAKYKGQQHWEIRQMESK